MLLTRIESSPAAAILAYCFSSMSMTLVNKYVVSGNEWNLNFFYLAVQAIVGTVAILALKRLGLMASLRPFETKKARALGMIYTSIQALQFLSVPVYTIFKNLTIIVIAYGEALGLSGGGSGHGITKLALLSFALMVLSSVVAAWADIQSVVTAAGDAAATDVKVTMSTLNAGYFWMSLNIFCAAAYALSNRKVMVKADLKSIDGKYHFGLYFMFYNNLLSIPILLVCSGLLEDWSASNIYRNFPVASRNHLIPGMVYSGLVAILISYCTPWCIRATSSTTYAMVGALNKLPVAILGIIFFAGPITVAGSAAIFIGVVSGVVYTWTKTRETAARGPSVGEPILPLSVARQKA
ncbi:hypothetical protein PG996_006311 [Apiospora saccharicola]|uniref:GDP-mannose transporter n=1 Tax=Apiospora saccharicola TaxID=335842 RepID=A0ABR1VT05_9PEZI